MIAHGPVPLNYGYFQGIRVLFLWSRRNEARRCKQRASRSIMNSDRRFSSTRSNAESTPTPGTLRKIASDCDEEDLIAHPYWPRISDGEYLAVCTRTFLHRGNRPFGPRVYLYFRIVLDEHEGTEIRMICRPSRFPSSNFFRAWSIANGAPPRSRNTRLSLKTFRGKLFRVLTTTVRPRHRITGLDGKIRPGQTLPEQLWYSKVQCLLSLEVTNEPIQGIPFCISRTPKSQFPTPSSQPPPRLVGREKKDYRSSVSHNRRGQIDNTHNRPTPRETLSSATPQPPAAYKEKDAASRDNEVENG